MLWWATLREQFVSLNDWDQMFLTAVILTKNEELHIERCLESLAGIASHCLVVDSGSTDRTVEIAREMGAKVVFHPWVNHAEQFNWALNSIPQKSDWVMRVDADELVTPGLAAEIRKRLPVFPEDVAGVHIPRRMAFLGRPIRWGGVFPVHVLRIFRAGRGRCESRWMDEHIVVDGITDSLCGELLDDNRSSLDWWTAKHNKYASLEVVDLLLAEGSVEAESALHLGVNTQAGIKRLLKEKLYRRLPGGFRAVVYFLYRYVVRLGFLDGPEGAAFHVLQGFWYRYLVDAKLYEVRSYIKKEGVDKYKAIKAVLGIDVMRITATQLPNK